MRRGDVAVNAEDTEQINRLFLTPVKTSLYMKENQTQYPTWGSCGWGLLGHIDVKSNIDLANVAA